MGGVGLLCGFAYFDGVVTLRSLAFVMEKEASSDGIFGAIR